MVPEHGIGLAGNSGTRPLDTSNESDRMGAGRMAKLDLTVEHDQSMDVAQAKLEAGVAEALSRFGSWVGRLDWSEDLQSATVSGSGYEVRLWYDEHAFHAQGHIPLAWKLFEGAVRHHIRKVIERPL
jgi:hypothetical protein